MKQNIFGVILFSIIVGTAIYVSQPFKTLSSPSAVTEKPVIVESRSRCGKTVYRPPVVSSLAKIKITQAFLNQNTNQLNTELEIQRKTNSVEYVGVSYYFFVKDGKATRFLANETIAVKPDFNGKNKVNQEIISSYSWLDGLDSKDNLYVIIEPNDDGFRPNSSIPRFEENNATPILLLKEKK